MRVDIFERSDAFGGKAYLAVPEGKAIPDEATDVEWETLQSAVETGDGTNVLANLDIDQVEEQISAKGYAISHNRHGM